MYYSAIFELESVRLQTNRENHGKTTVSDLADAFEKIFNIELKRDIYHAPNEMIQRADSAKFLSRLAAIIRRKMNDKSG